MLYPMQLEILTVGELEVNCVVLWSGPAQAWVVDPGADADRIRERLARTPLADELVPDEQRERGDETDDQGERDCERCPRRSVARR